MAKVCCNCGKKIGFGSDSYKLKASMEFFCPSCAKRVAPLLDGVKNAADLESFRRKSTEIQDFLDNSAFSHQAKQNIEYELQQISDKRMGELQKDFDGGATFDGTFNECYQMVLLSADGDVVGKPAITELGETKVVLFVFEQYFFRNDTYASLSVTLAYRDGRAYVTAAGSGGGEGMFNISWGFEGDYLRQFWRNLYAKYPHKDIQPYQVKAIEELD